MESRSSRSVALPALLVVAVLLLLATWLVGVGGDGDSDPATVAPPADVDTAGGLSAELTPDTSEPVTIVQAPAPPDDGADGQQLGALAATLHGVVRDQDGEPIADARVALVVKQPDAPATTTAVDGRFVLPVPEGLYAAGAEASHADFASEKRPFTGEVWSGAAPLEFRLAPVARIEGLLVDGEQRPLADASVTVETGGERFDMAYLDASLAEATSDEDGRFSLALARPQIVRVLVEPADGGPQHAFVQAVRDEPEQRWVLTLPALGELAVTLRSDPERLAALPDGALSKAKVLAVRPTLIPTLGGLRPSHAPLVDGVALLADLDRAQLYDVLLSVSGYQPSLLARAVRLETPRTELTVDLPELLPKARRPRPEPPSGAAWQVDWEILDEQGQVMATEQAWKRLPVGGSNATVWGRGTVTSLTSGEQHAVRLEQDGRTRGRLNLRLAQPVRFELAVDGRDLVFDPVRAGDTLSVRLRDDGRSQSVVLRPVDEHGRPVLCLYAEIWQRDDPSTRGLVMADHDGRLQTRLVRGRHVVRLMPLYGRPRTLATVDVPVPDPEGVVELLVHDSAALAGTVLPPPAPGTTCLALVEDLALPEQPGFQATTIGADGRFELAGLPAGPAQIGVWTRAADGSTSLSAERRLTLRPGELTRVELVCDREPAGRVVQFRSASVGALFVVVRPDDGGPAAGWDARSPGQLLRLPSGRYTAHCQDVSPVEAEEAERPVHRVPFEVPPGDGPLTIELP